MSHALRRSFAALGFLLLIPAALPAQSLTTGALSGIVRDTAGQPLLGVRVEVSSQTTGFRREVTTLRSGEFAFRLLPPGRYDVLAEMLGYRPTEIRGVPVSTELTVTVEARLAPATPPVLERTVVQAPDAGAAAGSALSWTLGPLELRGLPDSRRDAAMLGRYTSLGNDELTFEGLPSSMNVVTLDALPVSRPLHPGIRGGALDGLVYPLSSVSEVTVEGGGVDVEWSGFAGSRLTLHPLRGSRQFLARGFGDWTGSPVSRSQHFSPQDLGAHSFRGGVTLTGPAIRDTAAFALGFEAQRLEVPVPPSWEPTAADSALLAVATDSFGVDLGPRRAGRTAPVTVVSGFGRFEWQADANNLLSVFATGVRYDGDGLPLGPHRLDSPSATVEGSDLAVTASLTSAISRKFALELRAGVETGAREYLTSADPATRLTAGPIAFGNDPLLPGRFQRTAFRAYESVHYASGRHRIKIGGGGSFASYDVSTAYEQLGEFVFGGVDQLAAATGGFVQRVGRPQAGFKTYAFGGWFQDRWQAAPGLELLVGFRLEWEKIPADDINENDAWVAATRVPGDTAAGRPGQTEPVGYRGTSTEFSPRAALVWDLTGTQAWMLRVDGGLYFGDIGPTVLAEAISLVGPVVGRRGVGALADWPGVPGEAAAPTAGPVLSPLAFGTRSPRSTRVQAALSGSAGRATTLHLGGVYRHTDFLVRRRNLNLPIGTSGADQYGRPVYGELIQTGGALLARPGTNRRFSAFDDVYSLDFDGTSEYVGLTARLEQRAGLLTFSAGYTFSRTTDNWLGARDGRPDAMLTPFPDSLAGVDWTEGRSDFDVPHRLVLGAQLAFGGVRVAGFFRHESGQPFTPGFREGVDANGDGSYRNDPATVDESVTGVSDLLGSWDCLRRQVGRAFVERNACRGPAQRGLDVRLAFGPFRMGYPVELVIDALNLLEADVLDVDRALYLVDPAQAATIDPQTGAVSVPLMANPDFGRAVVRRGPGRFLRVGLRVNY